MFNVQTGIQIKMLFRSSYDKKFSNWLLVEMLFILFGLNMNDIKLI